MSAAVEKHVVEQAGKVRRKVKHLYWTDELDMARSLGLAVVSVCRAKVEKPFPVSQQTTIEVVGGLVALTREQDCANCARALAAALERGDKAPR
ncbi:hypothetical protein NPS01_42800 [Nocardioides psychrotolerans]|uniref:Uncharacterized protein n=1 Tax=Nocardioides psychrotolerans TaxID=1005945 RepID=A0A1I3M9M2_9ACTN|nr:hypothetical protein [Nocardioides psychrotolerans]GEP40617.1 hypothetical protein NPS01_42800 [Nocardioides psychrotolerans]SFI93754.1 hypothetical protein SAMN05216561_11524 [Nocardioides psychrotolerans]